MRCFVIGPIGAQGSDTRKNADHLFEYVIRPVVEGFSFDVVRADRLNTVASITEEIIRLIQESELCIIDLTEANPNVFYEAGRRHETGKPYIHLLQEGQKAPFDVQGTRYVGYKDLSITGNVFEAQASLRSFVEVVAKSGFGASKSTNPLNNIEESLRRIEARLATVLSVSKHSSADDSGLQFVDSQSLDPLGKVYAAYKARQYRAAEIALLELDEIYVDKNEVVEWCGRLARTGRKAAADLALKYIMNPSFVGKISGSAAASVYSGLSRYYVITGQGNAGKVNILTLVNTIMNEPVFNTFTPEQRAVIANAAQSICFSTEDLEGSQQFGEQVCKLEPTEPIWFANLATTLYLRQDYLRASTIFDNAIKLFEGAGTDVSPDILETGVNIYHALGQTKGMDHCLNLLRAQSPDRERTVRERVAASSRYDGP